MFVIRNNDSSILLMYKSIENAKKKLLEILKIESGSINEFVTKLVGHMNGHGYIYELSIKKSNTVKTKDFCSAFNNDPIMYNGPRGHYPDELDFLEPEDEDEGEDEGEDEDV